MTAALRFSIVVWVSLLALSAQAALPAYDGSDKALPSLAPLLEKVDASVVNIATFTERKVPQNPLLNDPFFRRFFNIPPGHHQQPSKRTQSAGSGVIIDAKKGLVVTNHHVIDGADEIVVSLEDGRSYKAHMIGSDADVDIAVVQLQDFDDLTAIKLADSSQLRVGDFVVAIGNPFGLGQTVTTGIVSALGRTGLGIEGYENFIQTDASINPGNSGGALINLRGELVGINTAILAPSGGNIGIGFAIPTNMAKVSIDQLVEHGEVRRGKLGVMIQDLTAELSEAFDLESQQRGVVVSGVAPNSAAEDAGLKPGDVVIAVDGEAVESAAQLRNQVGVRQVGDNLRLTVIRDGKTRVIKARIGESEHAVASNGGAGAGFLAGASLQDAQQGGVIITAVEPGSKASRYGLRRGDRILSVNRQKVDSVSDLNRLAAKSDDRLVLLIQRGQFTRYLVLR